jgi:hypothetical protein
MEVGEAAGEVAVTEDEEVEVAVVVEVGASRGGGIPNGGLNV